MALIRNVRTPEGEAIGKEHARFYEQELSKRPRELDERCSTCAFRLGTMANGSPTTQMDVTKCILEHVDFMCHDKGREGVLCHGYKLMRPRKDTVARKCPWPFSDDPLQKLEEKGEIIRDENGQYRPKRKNPNLSPRS